MQCTGQAHASCVATLTHLAETVLRRCVGIQRCGLFQRRNRAFVVRRNIPARRRKRGGDRSLAIGQTGAEHCDIRGDVAVARSQCRHALDQWRSQQSAQRSHVHNVVYEGQPTQPLLGVSTQATLVPTCRTRAHNRRRCAGVHTYEFRLSALPVRTCMQGVNGWSQALRLDSMKASIWSLSAWDGRNSMSNANWMEKCISFAT